MSAKCQKRIFSEVAAMLAYDPRVPVRIKVKRETHSRPSLLQSHCNAAVLKPAVTKHDGTDGKQAVDDL